MQSKRGRLKVEETKASVHASLWRGWKYSEFLFLIYQKRGGKAKNENETVRKGRVLLLEEY